uniref:SH3 domain-containing protein n=1 Tax=Panagrellus redivivus TaxID=6233 RepID=A0A7E4W5E9_PANRE
MDPYEKLSHPIREILDKRVPQKLDELAKTADHLENIADEQDEKYFKEGSNHDATLRETRNLAVQSLGNMALQFKELSSEMIRALDFESDMLASKCKELTDCSLESKIQQEKAARKEIGKWTISKVKESRPTVRYPIRHAPAPPQPTFGPINFDLFNDVGHPAKYYSPPVRRPDTLPVDRSGTLTSNKSVKSAVIAIPSMVDMRDMTPRSNTLSRNYRSAVFDYRKSSRTDAYSTVDIPASRASMATTPGQSSFIGSSSQTPSQRTPSSTQSITPSQKAPLASPDDLPPPPVIRPTCMPPPPPITVDKYLGPQPDTTTINSDWIPLEYIEKAIVIFDYVAQKPDELNLHENNIVYVVHKNEDGWYEGVLDGVTGLFPGNYVQKI